LIERQKSLLETFLQKGFGAGKKPAITLRQGESHEGKLHHNESDIPKKQWDVVKCNLDIIRHSAWQGRQCLRRRASGKS